MTINPSKPVYHESPELLYKAGYKFQVTHPYTIMTPFRGYSWNTDFYQMKKNGEFTIKALYAWDGPSGPALDTKDSMISSLLHDALCQAMNEGLLPRECHEAVDTFFRVVNRRAHMFSLRRWWFHAGVRLNAAFRVVGPNPQRSLKLKDGPEVQYWASELSRIRSRYPACVKKIQQIP
jgi:hypothetical protein